LHVGFEGRGLEERRIVTFDRQIDARERSDRLRLPVFQDLEVVLREIADEVSLRVRDPRVNLDVIDLDLERGRRWLLNLLLPG
jgi:hypothetical protein